MTVKKEFLKNEVKKIREKKGLLQDEVAKIIDVSHATVSRIKNEINVINSE